MDLDAAGLQRHNSELVVMAGFKREPRTIRLVFDDPELNGLEVLTRSVPMGLYMDLVRMAQEVDAKIQSASVVNMIETFAEQGLVSWNWCDPVSGEPVPPTLQGLRSQDTMDMMQIVMSWLGALGAAPVPLAPSSSNGSISDSLSYDLLN